MLRVLLVVLVGVAVAERWVQYKTQFGRAYEGEEETRRAACFARNEELIAQRNAKGMEKHGWNIFTDICPEEFKAMYHNLKLNDTADDEASVRGEDLPAPDASVDWRTKGAVTPVKNQAQCGSCWSFSATGVLEGVHQIATGHLIGLSEQEIVACDRVLNMGCDGGDMRRAITWVVNNGGIDSEADYPYTSGGGIAGFCKEAKKKVIVASFEKLVKIAESETAMETYMSAHGPLSIGVDAQNGWQTYTGGIFSADCSGRSLDHGVLAVGYGTEGATPYWIVKNSWTKSWGEEGYIRLKRGVNCCGLRAEASSAIAKNSTGF